MLTDQQWNIIDHIPGWMGREGCDWLAVTAAMAPSWTEIGSYCGRSATVVGWHLPLGALLQLVDIEFGPSFNEYLGNLQKARPDLMVKTYQISSLEASKIVERSHVGFIDAMHDYDSIHADILAWQDKVTLLCGHDYTQYWPGVVQAVNELIPGVTNPVYSIWVRP